MSLTKQQLFVPTKTPSYIAITRRPRFFRIGEWWVISTTTQRLLCGTILASSSDTTFFPWGNFYISFQVVSQSDVGCDKELQALGNRLPHLSVISLPSPSTGGDDQVMPLNCRGDSIRCQASFLVFLSLMMIAQGFVRLSSSPSVLRSTTSRFLTTNIFIVGKKNGGEQFISDGYAEYEKRLTPVMKINTVFLKSDEALVEATKAVKGTGKMKTISSIIAPANLLLSWCVMWAEFYLILILFYLVIALDENGSEYSSRDFSAVVYKGLEDGGANLTFVIGGFAGLPPEIKKSYPLMSLSKVIFYCRTRKILY